MQGCVAFGNLDLEHRVYVRHDVTADFELVVERGTQPVCPVEAVVSALDLVVEGEVLRSAGDQRNDG